MLPVQGQGGADLPRLLVDGELGGRGAVEAGAQGVADGAEGTSIGVRRRHLQGGEHKDNPE